MAKTEECWEPLADVAAKLQLTPRTLQLWVSGIGERVPLPCQRRGRRIYLRARQTWEHLTRHGVGRGVAPEAAKPKALRPKPAKTSKSGAKDGADPKSLHALLDDMAREEPGSVPASWVQAVTAACREARQVEELQARLESMVAPEAAQAMLRRLVEAFSRAIEETAARASEEIIQSLEASGVDVAANASASSIVESRVRAMAQRWVERVREA